MFRYFGKARRLASYASLVLVLAIVLVSSTAGAAEQIKGSFLDDHDEAMLLAFWGQEAYDGMNNGEAVYDIRLSEGGFLSVPKPEYDGTFMTDLITTGMHNGQTAITAFGFSYTLPGWQGESAPQQSAKPHTSPLVSVYPDLYGPLDLHGTSVLLFGSPIEDQTHITALNLNDCPNLSKLSFCGQKHCSEVTALNCPQLNNAQILNGAYDTIRFQHVSFERPVEVIAFGNGCVGAWYQTTGGSIDHSSVFAYPNGDSFVGWFSDGELVSTELEYNNVLGGKLIACFGGDADGNGSIDAADAVSVMRCAMSLTQATGNEAMSDVNGNGTIDIADAALILRFAIGVLAF